MKIKNPENFVSSVYYLETYAGLQIEATNQSAATLQKIKDAISAGKAAAQERKFESAITYYKKARAMAYQLLYPSTKPNRLSASRDLVLPAGSQVELKLAEASLKLLENMQPDLIKLVPLVNITGVTVPANIKTVTEEGIQVVQLNDYQIETQISKGTELLTRGEATEAVNILTEATKYLGTSGADNSVKATAYLNLSSALLALGNYAKAISVAQSATRLFKAGKDNIGQAQALHNIGTAQMKSGNTRQAQATLKQSSELFNKTVNPTTTPRVASSGTTRITLPGNVLADSRISTIPIGKLTTTKVLSTSLKPTSNTDKLDFIGAKDTNKISVRWVGDIETWSGLTIDKIKEPEAKQQTWKVGVHAVGKLVNLEWKPQSSPNAATLINSVYKARINATTLEQLKWFFDTEASTAIYLTHIYSYVAPVGIADAYHELGNYEKAEAYYILASQYTYLNKKLEATNLWTKLARNIQEWGDELYKDEKVEEAGAVYAKLITQEGKVPANSPLYKPAVFGVPVAIAKDIISKLGQNQAVMTNAAIATPIYIVWGRWQYILGGLDFYGLSFSPVFTFEYLQQMAKGLTMQSIQAEREFVNFMVQSESEAATRRDLQSSITMANAEVTIQQQQYEAAKDDSNAADYALQLANLRKQNAIEDRNTYKSDGYWQYIYQSIATAHGAGADWHENEIRDLAADMEAGSWKGKSGKLAAAATLLSGQKSYEYQLDRMANQIEELNATIPIAQSQAKAAAHREEAARLSWKAAETRLGLVQDALNAFENEYFTPETWAVMAAVMRSIAKSYQYWAIRTAKLMERAYNFETDNTLHVIKNSYGLNIGKLNSVFGADLLLKDIDSFTYHYITNTNSKDSKLKDVVSLRNEYPFDFYQFKNTGLMNFETALHDFDRKHPGFYSQRLENVEVEIIGLLPSEGVNGTMRGSYYSTYRAKDGSQKSRIHSTDTLALSEYTLRSDGILFRMDLQKRGLFEGNGVGGTWSLELPKRSNNFDYRLITDVRLVFYYTARYSFILKENVLNRAPLPGEMIHVRDFALRYDFPEVWYSFLKTKEMTLDVAPNLLPRNEQQFKTEKTAIQILTAEGVSASGIEITLTLPGKNPVTMTTDANGAIETKTNNALAAVMGGDFLGKWTLTIVPPVNCPLLKDEGLDPTKILNISIINQYEFEWA